MSFYVFTEDIEGRKGLAGARESEEVARDLAGDYLGITHIIEADNLVEVKRKLREKKIKEKEDLGEGYKNVRNRATLEAV